MEIKKINEHIEMEKRTHIPYEVSATCPKCGTVNTVNYAKNNYLSYPEVDQRVTIAIWCPNGDCENEGMIIDEQEFILNLTLTPVG